MFNTFSDIRSKSNVNIAPSRDNSETKHLFSSNIDYITLKAD
jgi:hypothetical protein